MLYLGVGNNKFKKLAVCSNRFYFKEEHPDNLCFDCHRHIDLILRYREGEDLSDTYYYLINRFYSQKPESVIKEKIKRFINFFEEIKKNGFSQDEANINVTETGVRLDGSHRVAIASVLGIEKIKVKVVQPEGKCLKILTKERDERAYYYKKYVGLEVFLKGVYEGRVIYTDIVKRSFLFLFNKNRLYHVLDTKKILAAEDCELCAYQNKKIYQP